MWEWREERGSWRLDDSGSWTWDEPSLLERVGAAPFGPRAGSAPAPPPLLSRPSLSPPPPVPPPPWAPPEPWFRGDGGRGGPGRAGGPGPEASWDHRVPVGGDPWDGPWLPLAAGPRFEPIPPEDTPIFAAVAEDHERDETAAGPGRLRPSRHGLPEALSIPEPSPGFGPFPAQGERSARTRVERDDPTRSVPAARHARTDAGGPREHADDEFDRYDGRHALRR